MRNVGDDSAEQARRRVLEGLFWLRNVALVAQLGLLMLAVFGLKLQLPVTPLWLVILSSWLWNLVLGLRLARPWPVSHAEIALNLGIDTVALTVLLYWAGGSTNPFVSLFLVPVALAAAFLPVRYILLTLALAVGGYSWLLGHYVPLAPVGSRFGGDFNLHVWGMWASFLLSAAITAVFVRRLAQARERRERDLAELRSRLQRNEQIVATGALAAGVAHEMNTPLSTIGLLAQELAEAPGEAAQVSADAAEILRQVAHCKTRLQRLQAKAGAGSGVAGSLEDTLHDWAAMRADVAVDFRLSLDEMPPFDDIERLSMALVNLLDNAADASLAAGEPRIEVEARWRAGRLVVDIGDFGPGLSEAHRRRAGREAFTSKPDGLGLGLVLTHAALEQIGGRLTLSNRPGGGLRTRVEITIGERGHGD